MVRFFTEKESDTRASMGIVKDYLQNVTDDKQEPESSYDLLLDMFENDAVLTTAVDTTVDEVTNNGYMIIGKNKKESKRIHELLNEDLDFDRVIRNIIYSMLIYGDAFMEIRRTDGEVSELHPLETTEMLIRYDKHGDILGYVQRPKSQEAEVPFLPDEVIHFRFKWIGSRVYSYTPFKSIMREYSTKKYAQTYLSRIFVNFPPRLMYTLANANKDQVKFFMENLKNAKNNPHKDLVGLGEIDVKETGMPNFQSGLVEILDYLRSEISMVTKVPPIWLGIPDTSGRSSGEAQIKSFESRIKSIQRNIESTFNKQFLKVIATAPLKMVFHPVSLMNEEMVFKNAEIMKNIGVDVNSILFYLKEKGMRIPVDAKVEKPEPPMGSPFGGDQAKGEDNRPGLNENGTSPEGARKAKEADQKIRGSFNNWTYDKVE